MLDLPPELLDQLCRWLPQGDLLSFGLTSKAHYAAAHPNLYHALVVDLARRTFDDPTGPRHAAFAHRMPCEPVVVRLLYALKRLLHSLLDPAHARLVRFLVVTDELPDVPALELHGLLARILPHCSNLLVLNWYAPAPLAVSLVHLLPSPHRLESLAGNFVFDAPMPARDFGALRCLDVSNFASAKLLHDVDLGCCPDLASLTVARRASCDRVRLSSRLPCCLGTATGPDFSAEPVFLQALFSTPLATKLTLSLLELKDLALGAEDARLLAANVDVAALRHLALDNCTETLFAESAALGVRVTRRTPPARLFLDVLAGELAALELLALGLANELCFNASTFAAVARLRGLRRLAVHIRVFQNGEPVSLAPLVNALQPHARTLEHLNMCCDVVDSAVCPRKANGYQLRSLLGLAQLRSLRVLRMPVALAQVAEVLRLLAGLSQLRIVQLGIADVAAASPCGGCNDTLIYALYNTNCLIAQDYFNCPSSFTSGVEDNKNQQYAALADEFEAVFPHLHYVRFDLKNQSLLYDTRDGVVAKDALLVDSFDSLVAQHV